MMRLTPSPRAYLPQTSPANPAHPTFGSKIAMRGKGNTILEKLMSLSEEERQQYLKVELMVQELTLDFYQRLDKLLKTPVQDKTLTKQTDDLKLLAKLLHMNPDEANRIIEAHQPG